MYINVPNTELYRLTFCCGCCLLKPESTIVFTCIVCVWVCNLVNKIPSKHVQATDP